MHRARFWCFVAIAWATAAGFISAQGVSFNRDVRPILADHCFQCHGPDAKQREADLRLDVAPSAEREGGPVIIAGKPEKSQLWRRVTTGDAEERMPPPEKGGKLAEAQLAILKQWILEGGAFEKHWSLLPVRRPEVPRVVSALRVATDGTRSVPATYSATYSPVDAFVRQRLDKEGFAPSPEAERWTLVRRASLALTGLPPTAEEVEAFVGVASPDAYERLVDRLLASPRYGERMAGPWLDAARYADTSGYQSDGERQMWRWRDWVIDALNGNMPFDRFTVEQLAGDLLPEPTLEQRIATGFNRNHRGNAEGGIIPEEYAVEYVADRVETTATVWLGLTLGCCRCHDHKYDPFTQRDFYSLFAFFNNVPEKGRAIKIGNSPPFIPAPTRLQGEELSQLGNELTAARRKWRRESRTLLEHMRSWEQSLSAEDQSDWYPTDGLAAHFPLDGSMANGGEDASGRMVEMPAYVPGQRGQAAQFERGGSLDMGNVGGFGFFDKFTLAAWIRVPADGGGTIVSRMKDEPQGDGYALSIVDGKLQFNLVKRWLDDALRVEAAEPLPSGQWQHVAATYDGSRVASGVQIYVNGQKQKLNVLLDELNQSFFSKEPLRIGGGGGAEGHFRGAIDEVRVYSRVLNDDELQVVLTPQSLAEIVAIPRERRQRGQLLKVEQYYVLHAGPESLRSAQREMMAVERRIKSFEEQLPTVMVMQEMAEPRAAHVLLRGQYDKPGERVEADVPAELLRMAGDAPRNRLGLAQWLVRRENPLVSRVTVNRFWQEYFGAGLVKTSEDFGRQGEWPSHPELLDWLAAEFMETGWDVKRLQRTIVTSATFRQESGFGARGSGAAARDPENRLLSRGPRLRLSAEMVRDQALFASGLLVEQVGGPSVKPPQPAGLWSELTGGADYEPGEGAERVRRSLYTFWKRTIPPPLLSTFDASSRETCIVRQTRTNTPLQALALMNEPSLVAAAGALAERVMDEAATPAGRIERAMLHVVGRRPTKDELSILRAALERYLHQPGPSLVAERREETIHSSGPSASQPSELAAYTIVCSTILNLDEAVTSQ